jgi:hypothetical protein
MARPRSLARVLIVITPIASGVTYAQQIEPNPLQVFSAR